MRSNSRCQGCQPRRGLFQEIQDVFLRQPEQRAAPLDAERFRALGRAGRHRAPQIVERALVVRAALAGALFLGAQVELLLAGIAIDAVRHQGMGGVERALDRGAAVALLALRDIALGEIEIIENALGVGPLPEQVIVLEEMIVAEGGMRDHQRLHRRGVFLHQIGDARRGVDHDLIGEAQQALAIERLVMGEMLAERPVLVEQRHADRGIGVQHLLGGDDLDLVGIDVEPELGLRAISSQASWMRCRVGKSQSAPSNSRSALRGSWRGLSPACGGVGTDRGTPGRSRCAR